MHCTNQDPDLHFSCGYGLCRLVRISVNTYICAPFGPTLISLVSNLLFTGMLVIQLSSQHQLLCIFKAISCLCAFWSPAKYQGRGYLIKPQDPIWFYVYQPMPNSFFPLSLCFTCSPSLTELLFSSLFLPALSVDPLCPTLTDVINLDCGQRSH